MIKSCTGNVFACICLFLGILWVQPVTLDAQAKKKDKYKITLKSRVITPGEGIKSSLKMSLMTDMERGKKKHVLLQLKRNLSKEERAELEKQGVKLLKYIGSYAWYAVVNNQQALDFTMTDSAKRSPVLGKVRWVGEIKKEDRVNPDVLAKGVAPHSRGKGGIIYILVSFHEDVDLKKAKNLIKQSGGKVTGSVKTLKTLQVSGPKEIIKKLITLDAVKWVDQLPPKGEDDNDELRAKSNVNVLQAAPYNLDGTNVTIGQWETGHVDQSHDDFGTRVTIGDATVVLSSHATHVCGTMIGDGSLSTGLGGTANQWRGVAVNGNCLSFRRPTSGSGLDIAGINTQYTTALAAPNRISLSNNSWGTGHYHTGSHYDAGCEFYDQVIRGELGRAIPILGSAGNQGPIHGTTWGTVRIPNSAKNTIEVGNLFSDRDEISWSSSTGPTEDGRLKPDVVAPGDQADDNLANPWGSGDKIRSTVPTDTYSEKSGTSMATPAVSGVIALMLQQYRLTYFGDVNSDEIPLPSTYKAILCHTAEDMTNEPKFHSGINFEGPDYIYGYGLIHAQEAVNVIRDKRFREAVILAEDDVEIYTFEVETGDSQLKVTLAWDDVAASPTDALVNILKNDLDLLLISPSGVEFYPPWELDPNNPATPAVRNFYATEALADAHADHVNVLEQVLVDNPTPGTWTIKVKATQLPEPYQRYSIIAGNQTDDQLAGKVDIMQVLDRSGSMGGNASSSAPDSKIQVLRLAADHFVQMMGTGTGNQLGLVQFNADVVPFLPAHDADLSPLTTPRVDTLRDDTIPSVVHGGLTSIGDGLRGALNQLTGSAAVAGNDKVILLVTDGHENRSEMIADVQADLIANKVAVYPLGLGYSSGVDETKLTSLADSTGGTYRITSDTLEFRKFFIEILAGALDWSVITDPFYHIGKSETKNHPVAITAGQNTVTFTAYWEDSDNPTKAIKLELIPPSGTANTIDFQTAALSNRIRCVEHDRYTLYQLHFPLDGSLSGDWAGQWTMKATGKDTIPNGQTVRFSMSAFARGGTEFEVKFDRLFHLTGDKVKIGATLTSNGKPVTGAVIDVYGNVPKVGAGNILHQNKVSPQQLGQANPDAVSLVNQKLNFLRKQAGKDVLERGSRRFQLFDDGAHGDGQANDGVYANDFDANRIPGSYTFRFVASYTRRNSRIKITREWTQSFYNEVKIDATHSVVEAILSQVKSSDNMLFHHYNVKVAPMDKYGNYLGPGRPVMLNIVFPSGRKQTEPMDDNIDGTYTKEIRIARDDVSAGTRIVIDVSGKTFTSIGNLPTSPAYGKWAASIHAGSTFPSGNLGTLYNTSYMFGFDLDYRITSNLSLLAFLGYNHFKAASPAWEDTSFWNLSGNLKYELGSSTWRPYINGGAGLYIPKKGNAKPGINFGLGVDFQLNPKWIIQLGGNYHHIFTSSTATKFAVTHGGLIFRF